MPAAEPPRKALVTSEAALLAARFAGWLADMAFFITGICTMRTVRGFEPGTLATVPGTVNQQRFHNQC